jgi:two-component system OmpR family sensor kinase
MNRLFLRFFLLVMFSVTLATLIIYGAIRMLFGNPLEQEAARQAAPHIFLLQHYIDQAAPDEWLPRLNKVREVSNVGFELIPLQQALDALDPSQHAALKQGQIVLDSAHKAFLRRVDLRGEKYIGSELDVLRVDRLPIDNSLAVKTELLRFVVLALALLLPIGWWSHAHWRALRDLASVADALGRGQLSSRVSIGKRASIYPLAEQINRMAGRVESLLANQQHLLGAISHELRTPLARLEFALELLRQPASAAKQQSRIDAMQTDLTELNTLVRELLEMARQDGAQTLAIEPFRVRELLAQCVSRQTRDQPTQVIELEADPALTGQAELRLLARAIDNLLGNAIKYGHGQIRLGARQQAGFLEIYVEDNGPGIPPAERSRIFEPFYRPDASRNRATGGVGLGLSIVRQIVLRHGGTLALDDSPMGGARFVLRLPQSGTGSSATEDLVTG